MDHCLLVHLLQSDVLVHSLACRKIKYNVREAVFNSEATNVSLGTQRFRGTTQHKQTNKDASSRFGEHKGFSQNTNKNASLRFGEQKLYNKISSRFRQNKGLFVRGGGGVVDATYPGV